MEYKMCNILGEKRGEKGGGTLQYCWVFNEGDVDVCKWKWAK